MALLVGTDYHRIRRISLDFALKQAQIEVAVFADAEAAHTASAPSTSLLFTCDDLPAPTPTPLPDDLPDDTTVLPDPPPSGTPHWDSWFSTEILDGSNQNLRAYTYFFLKTAVPLYEHAVDA